MLYVTPGSHARYVQEFDYFVSERRMFISKWYSHKRQWLYFTLGP